MSARAQEPFDAQVPGSTQRVVQQALRRDVNETIVRAGALTEPDTAHVLCECGQPTCTGKVLMTRAEYELVRRFPGRFLVRQGHEDSEDEQVVASFDGCLIVEKTGPAGLYAVGADPRRRPRGVAR